MILARGRDEGRVIVSADADFATLLMQTGKRSPSVIVFRARRAERPCDGSLCCVRKPAGIGTGTLPRLGLVVEEVRIRIHSLSIDGNN